MYNTPMHNLYRFSPIKNEEDLERVWEYITEQLEKLSQEILHEKLSVSILKVFPHYPNEYKYLYDAISNMGPQAKFSSKTSLYVEVSKEIMGNHISSLGIRFVDPYRMQVGCGDYEVDNFASYREKHIDSPFVRDAKDSTDMLEIWHPDFDVLGYVIPKE